MSRADPGTAVAATPAVSALLVLAVLSACALPRGMEPAVPGPDGCPAVAVGAHRPSTTESDSLRWYRASAERDRALAARWCATVGPPVLDLVPRRPADRASTEALRVVSWNVWIGGGDVDGFLSEELGFECGPADTDDVEPRRPFVLLLQEVWRYSEQLPDVGRSRIVPWTIAPQPPEGAGPDIVELAERCGLALVYVPSARNGPDTGLRPKEDKGNAILSNLRMTRPVAVDLPLEGGRKVAVAATVRTPRGDRLRVVSVHLDVASTLVRTVLSANQTRSRQAMGLVDALDRAEAEGFEVEATVVGADLNTWAANESALTRMLLAFPESPAWDGLATTRGFATDHILFRANDASGLRLAGYERIEHRYGSDHHARAALVVGASGR